MNAPQLDFSFSRRGKLKQFRFVTLMFKKIFKEPIKKVRSHAEKRSQNALFVIYACIRLLPRATCSSVIMHSCERVALSVSILQSSLFEKYTFFASIVCNEHRSIKVHKASLS